GAAHPPSDSLRLHPRLTARLIEKPLRFGVLETEVKRCLGQMPRRIDVGWTHPPRPPAPNVYLVCSTSLLTCPETDKLKPEHVRRSIAARLASKSATSSLALCDGSGCTPSVGRALLSGRLVKRPVSGPSKRRSSALTPGLISIAPSVMTDAQSIR